MAKELTDDELNLRRKARRRLIGAIALTLAVVVILPMVLESQPKPTGQEIDLRIPAPDKAGEFVPDIAISEIPVALPVSAVVTASAVAEISAPAAPEPAPVESFKPAENETTPNASNEQPAAAKTADQSAVDGFAVQVGAYSNANTAKQEYAKLKKWGFKAYTEKAGNKVRVRVGPYAEREKAEKVLKMIEKHGLHPVIVTIK
jgi:DedD protein